MSDSKRESVTALPDGPRCHPFGAEPVPVSGIAGITNANECDHVEHHTACPDGYVEWHAWAEKMAKTHTQRVCLSCGLWAIWEKKGPPQ